MTNPVNGPERLAVTRHDTSDENDAEVHRFTLMVPANLRWFRGHFDGHPVLPGVVQLQEAFLFARSLWPDLSVLRRIAQAKFRQPIGPEDELILRLDRRRGKQRVAFDFSRDGACCSSGTLEFEAPSG